MSKSCDTENLTKEKIQERATFEVEDLDREEERARTHALAYAKKIINEAEQFKKLLENPEFKTTNLREENLTWINQYSNQYTEYIKQANMLKQTRQNLRYTIGLVKESN